MFALAAELVFAAVSTGASLSFGLATSLFTTFSALFAGAGLRLGPVFVAGAVEASTGVATVVVAAAVVAGVVIARVSADVMGAVEGTAVQDLVSVSIEGLDPSFEVRAAGLQPHLALAVADLRGRPEFESENDHCPTEKSHQQSR